jgi:RHH-type proline utilization regulon transcriptional repressor/proline dehydrogenase/delta 1-pyrroline-5-carboxylate dehydrogenase
MHHPTTLRAAITNAYRMPEPDCVAALLPQAGLPAPLRDQARQTATTLVTALRAKNPERGIKSLIHEYALSSQEGVALMCLAEALLRIPDTATRDALIRDKIGAGDWRSHLGSPSMFVNAATWGLVVTGKLTGDFDEPGLGASLARLLARGGEPLIRKGVDMAMRLMGEQFVTGETIEAALTKARRLEAKGFSYSYDMLGEAAATAADAARYLAAYEHAIHAIGNAAAGRGPYKGPGISIKLSALHPRYTRTQRGRVMSELLPRVANLAGLAKSYDIGLNIDAEETDRLDLSLDILDALCTNPALDGWHGLGFVVQAYQKRAPFVLDFVIDLAARTRHRLMIRLVKGAYWDSEIKRAQQDGQDDFPVFTRKLHTDVSYLACGRKLLDARAKIFPQFATHNAATLAAILAMAGPNFAIGDYEFQCLHGMGEPLYGEVVGPAKLNRPCRIYAPVGTHETLLAYLVRRLLENGANASFVHRIQEPAVTIADLTADPVAQVAAEHPVGAPHPAIAHPRTLFTDRINSAGLDLSNEATLQALGETLARMAQKIWQAGGGTGQSCEIRNPANPNDLVGHVVNATPADIDAALARATEAAPDWRSTPPAARAASLRRAADLLEGERKNLLSLLIREAGKTIANAIGEIREAVDFLRYYAAQSDNPGTATHAPLGLAACISPWNFPLAIFTGQIAAALAAGNAVLAKPAEETPLIAAQAVALLHQAGILKDILQLLPGDGATGAQLVADPRINAVVFTGSTAAAKSIQRSLAERLNPDGAPVPLIAETGGQNALIVDSSALAEQVVADVLVSAFDSAGQRCSALRVLVLQDDIAGPILTMLRGAISELSLGNPADLSTDIGPVVSADARQMIETHIETMRRAGHPIFRAPFADLPGHFVAPTLIELPNLAALDREVFGPVLHVLRYRREALETVVETIAATGYALTFGLHSRIDQTIARVTAAAPAGNIYVNRNLIGAVVGVQPFGGHGLSGTGPKAGGPLYLRRLLQTCPPQPGRPGRAPPAARAWAAWLAETGDLDAAAAFQTALQTTPFGIERNLPGPVGERNLYTTQARGAVLCTAPTRAALLRQIGAALATGNIAAVDNLALLPALPAALANWVTAAVPRQNIAAALFAGAPEDCRALQQALAARPGPIAAIHTARDGHYPLEWLVQERSISTNTTAAGGNASLLAIV